jgi:hypothetical protein
MIFGQRKKMIASVLTCGAYCQREGGKETIPVQDGGIIGSWADFQPRPNRCPAALLFIFFFFFLLFSVF